MTEQTQPTDAELLPCPFCGGLVDLEETTSYYDEMYGNRQWWGVVCRNTTNRGGSCAIQQRPSASKEAAVERWNRRAPQPTQAQAGAVPLTGNAVNPCKHSILPFGAEEPFYRCRHCGYVSMKSEEFT